MKPHSVFLRNECTLPIRLNPLREPVGDGWMRVEEIPSSIFDTMIRQEGWHFMGVPPACARRGFGARPETATNMALTRALRGIPRRINSAELDSVRVAKYPGFYIANVTLQSRLIQEHTSLDFVDDVQPRGLAAK